MLRDSQFSHILLLIVIGFAIYYLTSPEQMTSTIKNVGTVDTDDSNTNDNKSTDNNSSEATEERVEVVSESVESPEVENVEARPSMEESRGIISEVEEELKKTYQSEQPETAPGAEVEGEGASKMHGFRPSETDGGANLNKAFSRPVPKGSKCNSVDFNRNYLKKYDSKNYLPQEVNDEWFDTDFTQAKNKLNSDSLINTEKYVIGVDTVGQSLKNASYDIRGTVANPKFNVSPWNNSTYEPDYNIKPLY